MKNKIKLRRRDSFWKSLKNTLLFRVGVYIRTDEAGLSNCRHEKYQESCCSCPQEKTCPIQSKIEAARLKMY